MTTHTSSGPLAADQRGYSLLEVLITMAILMIVSSTVMTGVMRMTRVNGSVSNRSEMHAGVRNATELLQQEVGQAGRITLPAPVTMTTATTAGTSNTVTVSPSTAGMFVGEWLVVDSGNLQESVQITALPSSTSFTANFEYAHAANVPVAVYGGFREGIVPPGATNGSSGTVLKMFGDINDTGTMVYVQYDCDLTNHMLYRRSITFDEALPDKTDDRALLTNIYENPGGTACFTYQIGTFNNQPFVVDVAITLTVQTEQADPITGLFQKETKALLNVSPRNVFNALLLAPQNVKGRVQPTPPAIATLLAQS